MRGEQEGWKAQGRIWGDPRRDGGPWETICGTLREDLRGPRKDRGLREDLGRGGRHGEEFGVTPRGMEDHRRDFGGPRSNGVTAGRMKDSRKGSGRSWRI